jgi:NAD(P)-dependent dehydrogenase (short-subunit alcohol dehydrogenase family)
MITKHFKNIMLKLKGRLDIIVLAHGTFSAGSILEVGQYEFDTFLRLNTRSFIHLLSLATPFLKLTKGNAVILSSVEAKIPSQDTFLNTVAKSMINSLIENSALELGYWGVRVNGVAPTWVNTGFRINEKFDKTSNQNYLDEVCNGYFLLDKTVSFVIILAD